MSITAAGGTKMRGVACKKSPAGPCGAVEHEASRRQGDRTAGLRRMTGKGDPSYSLTRIPLHFNYRDRQGVDTIIDILRNVGVPE